ncbi:MAG: hypothetical protein AAF310_06330 [Myxococcota bacterium]
MQQPRSSAQQQHEPPYTRVAHQLHLAITRHRLAPVLLFIGSSDQTDTTSIQLAQGLHCTHTSRQCLALGCQQCDNCQRIAKQLHPNVYKVCAAENSSATASTRVGIDQIRRMKQQQNLHSFAPGPQIWLVPYAHNLTLQAASALLKLLEEPHAQRFILLATPNEALLPNTVVSRCHKLFFSYNSNQPPCNSDMAQQISKLLAKIHNTPRLQRWPMAQQFPTHRDELGEWLQQMLQLQWHTTKKLCHQQPNSTALQRSMLATQALQQTYDDLHQHNANSKLAVEDLLLRSWP